MCLFLLYLSSAVFGVELERHGEGTQAFWQAVVLVTYLVHPSKVFHDLLLSQ